MAEKKPGCAQAQATKAWMCFQTTSVSEFNCFECQAQDIMFCYNVVIEIAQTNVATWFGPKMYFLNAIMVHVETQDPEITFPLL